MAGRDVSGDQNPRYSHGMATKENRATEYGIWSNIKQRCSNRNNPQWACYGGRGIYICDGWAASFRSFMEAVGPRPSLDHSLDRIDNDRGYTCGYCDSCTIKGDIYNCQWATATQQHRNMRKTVRVVFRDNERVLADLCDELGVSAVLVRRRLLEGWSPEEAVTRPKVERHSNASPRRKRYGTYLNMMHRCHKQRHKQFYKYGGRGITVCHRWRESFQAFYNDTGTPPKGMSLDRPDNDKGYWCGKCECQECGLLGREKNWRWATRAEQANNRRPGVRQRHVVTKQIIDGGRDINKVGSAMDAYHRKQKADARRHEGFARQLRLQGKTHTQIGKAIGKTQTNVSAMLREWERATFYTRCEIADMLGENQATVRQMENRGWVIPGRIQCDGNDLIGYLKSEVVPWLATEPQIPRVRSYEHLKLTNETLFVAYQQNGSWNTAARALGLDPSVLMRMVRSRGIVS